MRDIEKHNPQLAGVLPKTYNLFTSTLLKELLKKVSEIPASIDYDAFGRLTTRHDPVGLSSQIVYDADSRVVAMVDNEVTLKRFYQDKNHIRLEPANAKMSPIVVDPASDTHILGVLVGVLRKC